MSAELEGRIYRSVLRDVLCDEKQDEIIRMLQANGVAETVAADMLRRARKERIAVIRNAGIRRAAKGGLLMTGGIGLFCALWFGSGFTTGRILILCGLLVVFGLVLLISGVFDASLASSKKGPVHGES
jgi:hypothetical protein